MSCSCDCEDCSEDQYLLSDLDKYESLIEDLRYFYSVGMMGDFFEKIEREFPREFPNISKLKVIK